MDGTVTHNITLRGLSPQLSLGGSATVYPDNRASILLSIDSRERPFCGVSMFLSPPRAAAVISRLRSGKRCVQNYPGSAIQFSVDLTDAAAKTVIQFLEDSLRSISDQQMLQSASGTTIANVGGAA
jgi:hypothetical protein